MGGIGGGHVPVSSFWILAPFLSKVLLYHAESLNFDHTFFCKEKVYKKLKLKWLKSYENNKNFTELNF